MSQAARTPIHPNFLEDIRVRVGRSRELQVNTRYMSEVSEPLKLPLEELRRALALLESGRGDAELLLTVGACLFDGIFPPGLRGVLHNALGRCEKENDRVRLRFVLEDELIAALPFEILHDPQHGTWLALEDRLTLVRQPVLSGQGVVLPSRQQGLRLLVAAASPAGLPTLNWEAEVAEIRKALAPHADTGRAEVSVLPDATIPALNEALARGKFNALHIISHGDRIAQSREGVLVLCGEHGGADPLGERALNLLLRRHHGLRLVVLNGCNTAGPPNSADDEWLLRLNGRGLACAALEARVAAVVAMQHRVRDDHAVQFSRWFYTELSDGVPVETAVQRARAWLFSQLVAREPGSLSFASPVLLMGAPQGDVFEVSP